MSFADSVHALFRDSNAIWGFLTAARIVLALTPAVVWLAQRIGGVDDKADRPRVHGGKPIPRIGGLAIVIAIAGAMAIFVKPEGGYLGILLGTLMVAAIGLIDDIHGINAGLKMLGIVVAALIPVAGFGMKWESGRPSAGRQLRSWLGRLPADDLLDRPACEPRQPDRRNGRPRLRDRRDRLGLLRAAGGVVRQNGRGGSCRNRLRRDARVPSAQLQP